MGEQSSAWRGGHSHGRGPGWRKRAEAIRERDGHCCRWCGKTRAENGAALSVDLVRPWREFDNAEEANHEDNLVSLCRKCHGKKVKLENAWLRGDGLALQEYRRMVGISLPPRRPDQPLPATAPHLGPPPVPADTRAAREVERRRKIGAAHRGQKRTQSWCYKISAAKTKYYSDPEARAVSQKTSTALAQDATWRRKQSVGIRAAMRRPEVRAKQLAGIEAYHAARKAGQA